MLRSLLLCAALLAPVLAHAAETGLVPTRVIYPGEIVDGGALQEIELKTQRQKRAFAGAVATETAEVEGLVARRTLLPGRPIALAALRQAWLVEQGKPVEAVFNAGALQISATAVALQSGAAGDLVRLRNADSGKTFSGTVLADGTVLVGGAP